MRGQKSTFGRVTTLLCCAAVLAASAALAVINGEEDATGAYSAVAGFGSGCSSVLVAPRVMLTSAHCMPAHALSCTDTTADPLAVVFAEADAGWSGVASFNGRMVGVQGYVQRSDLFDLSQCASGDAYDCSDAAREIIDHSKELVVMYLAADAPADVAPLPILVHPSADTSHSAAEVGVFATLETWAQNEEPVVTTVGYGVGSHPEIVGTMPLRGRDYGLQRWVETSTDYGGFLGATSCNALAGAGSRPGVVVSPKDLTAAQIGDPTTVIAGANFYPPSQHSHSGGGDSGGPVLVGKGIGAHEDVPTQLPPPGSGDGYDPNRNYVVGTASLWVSYGQQELATAFNPTWTASASSFLMSALYDGDGDGYADPVDDDLDGDGCDNDVDQHPDDRWVPIGTVIHPNCNPSSTPWLGDEAIHSDPDGIPNCADDDDDNDGIPDDQDNCPVHAGNACFQFGSTCPWNPQFFDCRVAGCGEILVKLTSLINPDPTRDVFFRLISVAERAVTLAPPDGLSIEQSAKILAGAEVEARTLEATTVRRGLRRKTPERGPTGTTAPVEPRLLALEVVGPFGRYGADNVGGILAAFKPESVKIGDLRGANALLVKLSKDGRSLEISGTTAKIEK